MWHGTGAVWLLRAGLHYMRGATLGGCGSNCAGKRAPAAIRGDIAGGSLRGLPSRVSDPLSTLGYLTGAVL